MQTTVREQMLERSDKRLLLCQILLLAWMPMFLWSNMPAAVPGRALAGGLQLLALIAFIVVHASLSLGWRGAGTYLFMAYMVGFVTEAASIASGVPFGWFVHQVAAPKLLGVPVHVPLAYAFLGWLAWTLTCLLGRSHPAVVQRKTTWLLPVLGALILTGYDLAFDPIGSAVKGFWAYRYPSGLYGVPLSNFAGWITTGTIIFAGLTVIEPRLARHASPAVQGARYWLLPCIVWGVMTLQYPLLQISASSERVIVGGISYVTADIFETATITAFLVMLPPALAAMARALLLPDLSAD